MNTIEQIHNEIDTAQERLFDQAVAVINRNKVTDKEVAALEKAEKLKRLGFKAAKEVKLTEDLKRKGQLIVQTEEQAKLIQYYAKAYPFLKFLTAEELDRICIKYGLIHAPADKYTGSIPDKNLKEIEQAKELHYKDKVHGVRLQLNFRSGVPQEVRHFFNTETFDRSSVLYGLEIKPDTSLLALLPSHIDWFGDLYHGKGNKIEELSSDALYVAAPQTHFNLKGLKKLGLGYFTQRAAKKDPIVFRYVRGGVQVLTKWGKEADDPDLQIAKIN